MQVYRLANHWEGDYDAPPVRDLNNLKIEYGIYLESLEDKIEEYERLQMAVANTNRVFPELTDAPSEVEVYQAINRGVPRVQCKKKQSFLQRLFQ